jgi:hypothetical protein
MLHDLVHVKCDFVLSVETIANVNDGVYQGVFREVT